MLLSAVKTDRCNIGLNWIIIASSCLSVGQRACLSGVYCPIDKFKSRLILPLTYLSKCCVLDVTRASSGVSVFSRRVCHVE